MQKRMTHSMQALLQMSCPVPGCKGCLNLLSIFDQNKLIRVYLGTHTNTHTHRHTNGKGEETLK